MPVERCAWPGCRCREIDLRYLGRQLCARHWQRFCQMEEEGRAAEARQKLGLPPRPGRTTTSEKPLKEVP